MSDNLYNVAIALGAPGRGILAADESSGTIKKRFDNIKTESTEESRRDYREMLFRTDAMADHISGVILFDETIRQNAADGSSLVSLIQEQGSIPGIKVDKGAHALAGFPNEKITEGLDGLRQRLQEYHKLGARFAKWRAVIDINDDIPSETCIKANAHALARYAALCQEMDIVPIVEPEVLMDGNHTAEQCFAVTEYALKCLYDEMFTQQVFLEGTVLKPNMIVAGKKCMEQASIEEVAELTVQCLKRAVPSAVPSVVFLSGGQADIDATAHLNAMNSGFDLPWQLSFSYGRALQSAPLQAWSGKAKNIEAGKDAFAHRARMNGLATLGEWSQDLERATE
jgi:fructose-bisphosphate aldolase class I